MKRKTVARSRPRRSSRRAARDGLRRLEQHGLHDNAGGNHRIGGRRLHGVPGHRHRRPERPRLQPSRLRRPAGREEEPRREDVRAAVEEPERLHPELHDVREQVQGQPGHRCRLPDGGQHPDDGQEVPEHEMGRRRHERQDRLQGRHHEELRGPHLRGERGRLRGRLHRRADGAAGPRDDRQLGRRHPGPGGRPLHRGLPGRRQEGRPEHRRC